MQLALKHLVVPDFPASTAPAEVLLTLSPGQSVLLENVSWQAFESLLVELGDHRSARLAYDNGTLEIIAPTPEHEYYKEAVGDLVKDLAYELAQDYASFGSTTWKRQDLLAGVEPDNCFYVRNEPLIRGKVRLDLQQVPPPDLALEIDITSKSLSRFPIYARLEVPEIWQDDEGQLNIYHLQNQAYVEADTSLAFPQIPVQQIIPFIEEHRSLGTKNMRRAFREWVRQQLS